MHSGRSKPVDCVTVTITCFRLRGKPVKTVFMFWARNGWNFKCPSQIFDILYFNNYTFVRYKNCCLNRCSRTCFLGINLSKFQVIVKTVQAATFVDGIIHLKLFIFVLFLHFLVLKINKYCRAKDGCRAMLQFAGRQTPTCTIFQWILRPPGAQTRFFTFCWISQTAKFFEKFKCCF